MRKKINIAETESDLNDFLEKIVDHSEFRLKKIKLSEQDEWSFANGALAHKSNGFFCVIGVKNKYRHKEHLSLYQPQTAITGLILHKADKKVYVLLHMKMEPGNLKTGQYCPTVQASPTNYLMTHGGKKTPCIDLFLGFNRNAHLIVNNTQLDVGQRYFQKTKTHAYIEVDTFLETEENMIWVSLEALSAAIKKDHFFNSELRSLLGIFDWDLYLNPNLAKERIKEMANTGDLLSGNLSGIDEWQVVPINSLKDWQITETGIQNISDSGVWVEMFDIQCKAREVSNWQQPLMLFNNTGTVVLLMRKNNNQLEFLITIDNEFGVSGQKTILPSYLQYPGENKMDTTNFTNSGTVVAGLDQSIEGGRFYRNDLAFKVIEIREDIRISNNQRWVSLPEFRSVLKTSCFVSHPLRCTASLILNKLNPNTFK